MEVSGKKPEEIVEKRLQMSTLSDTTLLESIEQAGPSSIRSATYKVPNNCPSVRT
jgi:hypothetical protein